MKKITVSQLRDIIREELSLIEEQKTTTGFPDELPVDVDKTAALERYKQEMSSLQAQIASASSSAEKVALQGKLQDVSKAHDKLAQTGKLAT